MNNISKILLFALAMFFTACGETRPYYVINCESYRDRTFDYKEIDNCVYYTDANGYDNKVCGNYSIYGKNGARLKEAQYTENFKLRRN